MKLLCAAGALFVLAATAWGQTTGAQVTGSVADASAAAVPGARITITNQNTGVKRETESNEAGIYTIPLLPPGAYQVTVHKDGFKPVTRGGVVLQVGQVARLDFALEVGAVTETIEVRAATPLLDQETSSLGQVIDNSKIVSIPLNGRSPFRLVQLTPTVLNAPSANGQFGDMPVNTMDDSIFAINGGRAKTNEILIDGVPTTTGFVNVMTTIPSPDVAQEFKVQSNNLSAEYGRIGGGVVNVSTRSGSNALHGSAFHFLRNSAMDANEFFNKRAGRDIPPFRMNQYGFAAGGPARLGKLYDGRNRTFFFADFQGTRWNRGDVFITTVPTALERQGDFTRTFNQQGQQLLIFDPFSTRSDPSRPGAFVRDALPGNVLPRSRLDPIALKMSDYYPAANAAGAAFTNQNNFISNEPRRIDQANFGARADHNLSDAWRRFGRWAANRTTLAQPDNFRNVATPGVGANGKLRLYNYTAAFDNTITLNPATILNARYGFARFFWNRPTRSFGFDQTQLGYPASLAGQFPIPLYPILSVEGYSNQGGGSFLKTGQDTHSLLASIIKVAGRHNLKFGVDGRLRRNNVFNLTSGGGNYSFTRAMTRGPDPIPFSANTGVGMASFLLGAATSGTTNIAAGNSLQNFYYAGYLQDDFKLSKRLTINLGIRYEAESPYTERRNQVNWFDTALASPARNPAFPNLTGGLQFASPGDRYIMDWDHNNISPRVGVAYSLASKTVFRAGAGLFYSPLVVSNSDTGFVPSSGYSSTTPMVASLNAVNPFRTLSNPFPDGFVQPTRDSLGASTFLGLGPSVLDRPSRIPYTWQWNADLQQELPWQMVAEAAYSASRGVKLNQVREYNALHPQYLPLGNALMALVPNPFYRIITAGALAQPNVARRQLLLPYPQFSGVSIINAPSGNSTYHSLALKLEKRFSQGVSFLVSYTIAKLIADVRNSITSNDNNLNAGLNPTVQDWYNLRAERSLSEFDLAQSFVASFVGELPFGPGKPLLAKVNPVVDRIIGGWHVSGVVTYRSGTPLILSAPVTGGGNRPNSTGRSARLPGGRSRDDEINRWFDPAVFTAPDPFTFGNVSRTLPDVRSPSLTNIDAGLLKNIALWEKTELQFRAEAFNLFNKPNLGLPNTGFGSLQFGTISRTTGLPHVMQVSLKLLF